MGISYCHLYVGMSEHTLKHQYVSAIHHKMTGECMAQNVG